MSQAFGTSSSLVGNLPQDYNPLTEPLRYGDLVRIQQDMPEDVGSFERRWPECAGRLGRVTFKQLTMSDIIILNDNSWQINFRREWLTLLARSRNFTESTPSVVLTNKQKTWEVK